MNLMQKLVTFSLDDGRFALHAAAVLRVIRAVEITPLPNAPEIVSGILNIQGQIVPVYDIRARFHLPTREVSLSDHLIIAATEKRNIALLVDSVDDVIETPEEKIVAAERILPELEYVQGVVKTQDGMILIHDLERFLSPGEERALEEAMGGIEPR
jgi:purine-binding chemotaxis protein CheW